MDEYILSYFDKLVFQIGKYPRTKRQPLVQCKKHSIISILKCWPCDMIIANSPVLISEKDHLFFIVNKYSDIYIFAVLCRRTNSMYIIFMVSLERCTLLLNRTGLMCYCWSLMNVIDDKKSFYKNTNLVSFSFNPINIINIIVNNKYLKICFI